MAKISNLPVELLEHIFDNMALASTFSVKWHRNLPTPSRALFPFNVASTCLLWLSVLKSKPEYWRQVVIDVADDPTPFLDTLALFKSDGYDNARVIVVFSSMKDSVSQASSRNDESVHEEAKAIENMRARAVFERLEGSVTDCGSIAFNLVFQSSLPSSARLCTHQLPLLHNLSLTCVIHDCDEVEATPYQGQHRFFPLRSLKSIAITGISFMQLCDCGPDQTFPLNQLFSLELSIDHFIFNDADEVKIFQTVLAGVNSYATLLLSDLNFTGFASARPSSDIIIEVGHLVFNSVSAEFLDEFMPTIFQYANVQILSFQRCIIPDAFCPSASAMDLTESLQLLQLIDIPYSSDEDSLSNAIYGLTPEHVRILRCGTVTDELFQQLTSPECSRIKTLELRDCSGFTSAGVREFICSRRDLYCEDSDQHEMFEALEVHGMGPLLSTDDVAFFLAQATGKKRDESDEDVSEDSAEESDEEVDTESEEDSDDDDGPDSEELTEDSNVTRVEWNVVGHSNVPDGYTTDLRPLDAARPIRLDDCLLGCISKDEMLRVLFIGIVF